MKKIVIYGEVLSETADPQEDGSVVRTYVLKEPRKKYACVQCGFCTDWVDVLEMHAKYKHGDKTLGEAVSYR